MTDQLDTESLLDKRLNGSCIENSWLGSAYMRLLFTCTDCESFTPVRFIARRLTCSANLPPVVQLSSSSRSASMSSYHQGSCIIGVALGLTRALAFTSNSDASSSLSESSKSPMSRKCLIISAGPTSCCKDKLICSRRSIAVSTSSCDLFIARLKSSTMRRSSALSVDVASMVLIVVKTG